MNACLCVGGTSWIWSSCFCPSWASLWKRSRRLLCPSTPPSSASWECWGSHEVWTPPPSDSPPAHPSSMTQSLPVMSLRPWKGHNFTVPSKTAMFLGLPSFVMAGLSRVWAEQMAQRNTALTRSEKNTGRGTKKGERWGKIADCGGDPRQIKTVN